MLYIAKFPSNTTPELLLEVKSSSKIVSDYVGYLLDQQTIQLGQPAAVKVAANLVSKNMLQTGGLIIVGGWDKYEGGKIYGVGRLGGSGTVVIEQPFAIGGSGSSYLYGFFDQAWKQGMTEQEAEQLIVKALSLAIARDGATGGIVRTVTINSQGVSRNFYPVDTDLEAHTYGHDGIMSFLFKLANLIICTIILVISLALIFF
ncbi:hypothetical protein Q3G72_005850 [Acer saccharum]|nr:hypothetical protein Q3G72_005850 [Acer saccharum]